MPIGRPVRERITTQMTARMGWALPALTAWLALFALAWLLPTSRGVLVEQFGAAIWRQADPVAAGGGAADYTPLAMVLWGVTGVLVAASVYALVFVRGGFRFERSFVVALIPALVFGPLANALLLTGAFRWGSPLAYATAQPVVYLSATALASLGLAAWRVSGRAWTAWALTGAVTLGFVGLALTRASAAALEQVGFILALALLPAMVAAWAWTRWQPRPGPGRGVVFALAAAHGLDGATTWMVLRDPFGLGFAGYSETNPVSEQIVSLANGWPYFALKLALPFVVLAVLEAPKDDRERRLHHVLLLLVFVLGYGPGASNLFQVLLA